ncbi:MAG: hypothetical protein WCE75_00705 [Terracidiphilus sp.]
MRERITATLGYVAAGLTLAIAVLVPFLLMGTFEDAVAHAGLRVDDAYTGGAVARTVERGGYRILVYRAVQPKGLRQGEAFVQLAFEPAGKLPAEVNETADLDGDGQPDVQVRFTMAGDTEAPLRGKVIALNSRYQSFASPAGESMTRIVARTGDRVLVRVPVSR